MFRPIVFSLPISTFRLVDVSTFPVSAFRLFGVSAFLLAVGCTQKPAWNQWGGPSRDFTVAEATVAPTWPETGPKKLWSRSLGDGFSTIVTDGSRLYTMYRGEGDTEVVCALDAATGNTVWEQKYPAPFIEIVKDEIDPKTGQKKIEKQVIQFGTGPNSTPLLVNGRLYTIGFTGKMHCLDAGSGRVLWSHDLYNDLGATYQMFGWATSPIAYGENVIVLTGGKGHGVTAFNQSTGKIAWQSTDYASSYSSPIIVKVDEEDVLIAYMSTHLLGLCPKTGDLHWNIEHKNEYGSTIATPIWCPGNRLYFVNGGDTAGGRVIKLARSGDKITTEDVWANKKIHGGLANPVRVGEYIYGPNSPGENVKLISAVNLATGEIAWQERGVPGPKTLAIGDRLLVLDDDGNLMQLSASPTGMKLLGSKAKLLETPAWTAPTLVGSKLYLRDKKTIMAVDLG